MPIVQSTLSSLQHDPCCKLVLPITLVIATCRMLQLQPARVCGEGMLQGWPSSFNIAYVVVATRRMLQSERMQGRAQWRWSSPPVRVSTTVVLQRNGCNNIGFGKTFHNSDHSTAARLAVMAIDIWSNGSGHGSPPSPFVMRIQAKKGGSCGWHAVGNGWC